MSAEHTDSSKFHISILGAGLLGRLSAWRLLEAGHQVTLYEAGAFTPSPAAAHTAAAMISPLTEVVVSEPLIYELGLRSLELWPAWIAELNKVLPQTPPVDYQANGSLVIAHPQDAFELEQFYRDLEGKLGGKQPSQWLGQAQIEELEPQLNHFRAGIYLPDEAYLDNRQLLNNLLQRIEQLGGQCLEQAAIELTDIENGQTDIKADWLLDCRGMGAKLDIQRGAKQGIQKGAKQDIDNDTLPPLRGVRGEVMWVDCPEVSLQRPVRLMHPRYKLYIVPKPQGQFIIGATEIESEDRSPISLQSSMELSSALYTLNPAFAEARIIETDVNLRPAFMDNLPKIARRAVNAPSGAIPLIAMNGLYRHGYLLAPAVLDQALHPILQHSQFETALL